MHHATSLASIGPRLQLIQLQGSQHVVCRPRTMLNLSKRWPVQTLLTTTTVCERFWGDCRIHSLRRCRAASTSSFTDDDSVEEQDPPERRVPRRRRQRHRFQVDEVPSFHEFQQQQRARGLYRQFCRLVWPTPQRTELVRQVRHEFLQAASTKDEWQVKRALSEGSRRLKELSAMLDGSVKVEGGRVPPAVVGATHPAQQWPWQRQESDQPHRPVPFPPKSM